MLSEVECDEVEDREGSETSMKGKRGERRKG